MLQLIFIRGAHNNHIGHLSEIGNIINPLVCRSVIRNDPRPVENKDNRDVHQSDIMIELVVSPLKKRAVNGDDRLEALGMLGWRMQKWSTYLTASAGLSDSAPDWGIGLTFVSRR